MSRSATHDFFGTCGLLRKRKISPEATLIRDDIILKNISGAPFPIERKVKVIKRIGDTISAKFIGQKGKVMYFDFTCGCEQSYPSDPMIGVPFPDETIEEFWREELSGCWSDCNRKL